LPGAAWRVTLAQRHRRENRGKKPLFAAAFAGVVLRVGTASGLATAWLIGGAFLAGGFGWMLGGTPAGPSGPDSYTGSGPDA
jgi:hypothetical protein